MAVHYDQKLLLVEDEEEIQEMVVDLLKSQGFQNVFSAQNGLEALEIVKNNPIDIIVSDLFMPKMNGIQLYQELKSRGILPRFILVTGSDVEDAIPDAMENLDIIQKPFSFDYFISYIQEACSSLEAS